MPREDIKPFLGREDIKPNITSKQAAVTAQPPGLDELACVDLNQMNQHYKI
jgi:hypothetical protein